MTQSVRRVVTGHDEHGRSVVVSDGAPPQHHSMHGPAVGADFVEIWNAPQAIPLLTAVEAREPKEREFTIMPVAGHLLRILEVYPPQAGGKRTVMHRTQTLDYVVMIEGELVLLLDDHEVTLKAGDVVVQRGTDHAWGGHHIVLGGAVQGGIYGSMPNFVLDGDHDASNRGVWIPTIGTVQYGATLGRWFGATPTELAWAFPNLGNFPVADLGFMRR